MRNCLSRFLSIVAFAALAGAGPLAHTVQAQVLVPHQVELDRTNLERQGMILAREAIQLAQFRQTEEALARARLAVRLAPRAYETWAVLGSLYLRNQDFSKAISNLQEASRRAPNNPDLLSSLGSAYLQQGNHAQAVQSLQNALKLAGGNSAGTRFDLGNAYFQLRRFREAIDQYSRALALEGKFWPAMNNIGLVEYESGNARSAIRRWEAALAIDSEAAEPKLALAVALYKLGQRERGLSLGEAALRLDPRYASPDFLRENLWGERLLTDARSVLSNPRIQSTLRDARPSSPPTPEASGN
ncbi:tetratricopeptide repeat protein [Leptolyngbya sp. FACHB-261]|uniref:tetratricopeptide repeat protein n=1 Tax=Leptolyngbya sp. FACHB-261 TaxID=2692806 RepID=UPI0018F05A13|nr:tetratricopeptide repeat protein [Leptolyngbya sp. FACHB-261]